MALGRSEALPVRLWSVGDIDTKDIPDQCREKPLVFPTRNTQRRKRASQPYGSYRSLLDYMLVDIVSAFAPVGLLSVLAFLRSLHPLVHFQVAKLS